MPRVTLYSRPGCYLCEDARRALEAALPELEIEEVDVDSDRDLCDRYGWHVPVAMAGALELFRHRFDPACIRRLGAN